MQLEKIVIELGQAVYQALEDQERITMELEAKVKDLEKSIEQQNQGPRLRDDAQNSIDKNAADKGEEFAKTLEEKDMLVADLRKQLQQSLTPVAVKAAISNPARSW